MEVPIAHIKSLSQNADKAGRQEILNALRKLQTELENPMETLMQLSNFNILIAMFRIAVDVKLFQILAAKPEASSVDQIAQESGVTPELLARILRYLASMNIIEETSNVGYQANKITRFFASPKAQGQVLHGFETNIPVARELFSFLSSTDYHDITNNAHTPFQKTWRTEIHPFQWFAQNTERFRHFHEGLASMASPAWIDAVAVFRDEAKKISNPPKPRDIPFFVDVGGGFGQQSVLLGQRYPNLLGHIVMQDMPQTISLLPALEGINTQPHDFFQRQPIKGAPFYYLRRVLHTWPDTEATKILQNLALSLAPTSRILVEEIVMPAIGAHWHSTMIDLSMMMAFAGKERNAQQWTELAKRSGLSIEQIITYDKASYVSVIIMKAS